MMADVIFENLNTPASITKHLLDERSNRPPVQEFQLNGLLAIEIIDLGHEGQIKLSIRQGILTGIPPNRFKGGRPIGHPHFDVLFFGTHPQGGPGLFHVAGVKLHRRIALTSGRERFQFPAQHFERLNSFKPATASKRKGG